MTGPFPAYGPPRRVEGGIKARSTRGAIGESWWSRRFIEVLESFAIGTRLSRGRSYARKGQVISLDVAPGKVTASVQGSRVRPYRVTVGLAPFPARTWSEIEVSLAGQALYSAHLLAGEMPPEIEQVFAAAGAPLFPTAIGELAMSCDCPDAAVPCKHLAATFYLLAEAFDADPFRILHWRGRERDQLLARLRELRSGPSKPGKTAKRAAPPVAGADMALAEVTSAPLADTIDRYWLPPVPLPGRPATLDTEPDLLLRQLPPPGPGLGGAELTEQLRDAYQKFRSSR
jgi:uncharacterized Zn finger protein